MEAYAVSRAVNSVKNDTEECIERLPEESGNLMSREVACVVAVFRLLEFAASSDPGDAVRIDADDHGKNIGHGLEMSGTKRSRPGALSSSFMSKSESHSAQPV